MGKDWLKLIAALPMPVALVDPAGFRIVMINSAFAHAFGYTVEEAQRLTMLDVTHVDDLEASKKRLKALLDGSISEYHVERRFLAKDGRNIWVDLSMAILRDEAGNLERLICMMSDVSERQRVQEELRRARIAVEAANRAKNEFLSNMSHELRTPLNAISGLTHLTMQTALDSWQRDNLTKIQDACKDLLVIVNDVLDVSRIELGTLPLERLPFDLQKIIGTLEAQFSGKAEEKGLQAHSLIDPEIPVHLIGDGPQLKRILEHLLENAVKFTKQGTVRLEVTESREHKSPGGAVLRFVVSDTGIGMDETQLARVFELFTQGDGSFNRQFGGTGLGLSIVQRLLGLMGGKLQVESALGIGSTFSFSMPFEVVQSLSNSFEEASARLQGKRILVVDDNPINQKIVTGLLVQRGLVVETAGNGRLALAAAAHRRFDFILMDVEMPEMNGYDATRAIRKLEGYETVPILAMTGHRFSDDATPWRGAGMDDFLEKPISSGTLIEALFRCLSNRGHITLPRRPCPGAVAEREKSGLPQALPGIDVADALFRIEGNQDLYVSLLGEFRETHASMVSRLRLGVESKNRDAALQLAHSLKGVAANLGARRVCRCVENLEVSLKGGEFEDVPRIMKDLEEAMTEVFGSIDRLMDLRKGSSPAVAYDVEAPGIERLISDLMTQLSRKHLGALESFASLEGALPAGPELEMLKKALKKLDFPNAAIALGNLSQKLGFPIRIPEK